MRHQIWGRNAQGQLCSTIAQECLNFETLQYYWIMSYPQPSLVGEEFAKRKLGCPDWV